MAFVERKCVDRPRGCRQVGVVLQEAGHVAAARIEPRQSDMRMKHTMFGRKANGDTASFDLALQAYQGRLRFDACPHGMRNTLSFEYSGASYGKFERFEGYG